MRRTTNQYVLYGRITEAGTVGGYEFGAMAC